MSHQIIIDVTNTTHLYSKDHFCVRSNLRSSTLAHCDIFLAAAEREAIYTTTKIVKKTDVYMSSKSVRIRYN